MKQSQNLYQNQIDSSATQALEDPILDSKIDILIQQTQNVTIPAIVFEYNSKENTEFEYNDLKNLFLNFGEVEDYELKGKICCCLFKNFFTANACREFLLNKENFKDNMYKNFISRWFNLETDSFLLTDEEKEKFQAISKKNMGNITSNNMAFAMNMKNKKMQNQNPMVMNNMNNQFMQMKMMQQMNPQMGMNHMNPQIAQQMGQNQMQQMNPAYFNNPQFMMNQMQMMKNNQNPPNNFQQFPNQNQPNKMNFFGNANMGNKHQGNKMQQEVFEEKNYGKFTCKFEILIPNDQEFQVVRRLIGSKGCNMKKIVDLCKTDQNNSNVKLRLRGKGSGYKEGPQNKESDDPLHLCISAKNQESLKKASNLVTELIDKIYDEYKKYCFKNGIPPVPKIANKIDGVNTMLLKGMNNNQMPQPMNMVPNLGIPMNMAQ